MKKLLKVRIVFMTPTFEPTLDELRREGQGNNAIVHIRK